MLLNRPMRSSRGMKRGPAAKHSIRKLWYLAAVLITGVALTGPASLAHAATTSYECGQISAQVCVSPSYQNYAGLVKGWEWVTKNYGVPKDTDDEFTDWYLLCTISPYTRACAGELHSAIVAGLPPSLDTEVLWNRDLDIGVAANGKAVPVVPDSVAGHLQDLVRQALVKFNGKGIDLTRAQLAAIEENPNLYNAYKGHQVDAYVKKELLKSGADEEYDLYITRPGEFGPDVVDLSGLPEWVAWYDITTSAQWAAHAARYLEVFGPNGYGIFWDQIEEELDAEGGGGEIDRIGAGPLADSFWAGPFRGSAG
jgi:hypothetical protein